MGLRTIHLLFIVASIAMTVMIAVWGTGMYLSDRGGWGHLMFGAGSLLSGAGMAAYLSYFIRKTRRIGMQ